MADTKTTALTELASGAIDDLDVAPVVDVSDTTQGASGTLKKFKWSSIKATLATYFDTVYLKLTGGTVAGGTRTTSGSTLTITETLNNAGVTFPGAVVVDVTDTASASGSLLADFKVDGSSKAKITKTGDITFDRGDYGGVNILSSGSRYSALSFGVLGSVRLSVGNTYVSTNSIPFIASWGGWFELNTESEGPNRVKLYMDAPGILAQRDGTNAQTYRNYGTYTDASNYRRVALAMTTAGVATLAPEGAGTGASGNVLHISGLPTSNPGPGILWNDTGTVKVGT